MKKAEKTVLFAKNFYLHQELRGIADYARDHGWRLEMPQMFDLKNHIRRWRGNGYLTDTGYEVEQLSGAGVRVVGLSLDPELKRCADGIVAPDNVRIGIVAAEYFLRRGYRHYAVCADCYGRDKAFEARISREGFHAERLSMPRFHRRRSRSTNWPGNLPVCRVPAESSATTTGKRPRSSMRPDSHTAKFPAISPSSASATRS